MVISLRMRHPRACISFLGTWIANPPVPLRLMQKTEYKDA